MTEYSRSIAKTKDGEYIFDEETKTFLFWVGGNTKITAQRPNDLQYIELFHNHLIFYYRK